MQKHLIAESAVSAFVESVINTYTYGEKSKTAGGVVAKTIAEFYAVTNGNDKEFTFYFGNGIKGKQNDVGEIRRAVDKRIAKMPEAKRTGIVNIVKQRLAEARKLREEYNGMPQKDETIQSALKRYAGTKAKSAKPEGNDVQKFTIPEELTHEQLADALSLWLAAQTPAKAKALAKDIEDMFAPAPKQSEKQKAA